MTMEMEPEKKNAYFRAMKLKGDRNSAFLKSKGGASVYANHTLKAMESLEGFGARSKSLVPLLAMGKTISGPYLSQRPGKIMLSKKQSSLG